MSHFTVTINDVLETMKRTSGITRQSFAQRVGVPMSTFASYTSGRTKPDAQSLELICSGLEDEDAYRVVLSHLADETPRQWVGRLTIGDNAGETRECTRMDDLETLPTEFRARVEFLLKQAQENEHIIGLIDELCALLGYQPAEDPVCQPPFREQNVPVGPVLARGGGLTPLLRVAEDQDDPTPLPAPRDRARGYGKSKAGRKGKSPSS
ncbi:MAG TPA: helix-turn-helix transcriptional regulator [Chthoniobacteraceae bacterium]|jgi:transcriptional regulator with XRE-family HTH domain